jgi:hypothetical protein
MKADECGGGGGGGGSGLVDRDGGSCVDSAGGSASTAAVVPLHWIVDAVELFRVWWRRRQWIGRERRRQWRRCSGADESGGGGGGGLVDRDGGSGVDAVELTSLLAAAVAVDWSTETAVVASIQWS